MSKSPRVELVSEEAAARQVLAVGVWLQRSHQGAQGDVQIEQNRWMG